MLSLIVLSETIYGYYYQSRYKVDETRINAYMKSLDFILHEGGGFNFPNARNYINPSDQTIVHLAQELETPEKIFDFVRHYVKYENITSEENLYDYIVLDSKESNCAGQSNLLCSILRAYGFPPQECRIVYGRIVKNKVEGNHAWVELVLKGNWIVLDPTPFTPYRKFGGWLKRDFYRKYQVVPVFEYNDAYAQFHRF